MLELTSILRRRLSASNSPAAVVLGPSLTRLALLASLSDLVVCQLAAKQRQNHPHWRRLSTTATPLILPFKNRGRGTAEPCPSGYVAETTGFSRPGKWATAHPWRCLV